MDRTIVDGLLTKLGVDKSGIGKINNERALKKLIHRYGQLDEATTRLEFYGGCSADEQEVLRGTGHIVPGQENGTAAAPKGNDGKTEAEVSAPHRLPGIGGKTEDRVENITPAQAASRNKRYEKEGSDRRWVLDAAAAVTHEGGTPIKPAKTAGKTPETPKSEAKTPAKGAKTAVAAKQTGDKGKKVASAKETKTSAKIAGKGKRAGEAKPRPGFAAKFVKMFESSKPRKKKEVVAEFVAAGARKQLITGYICYAKRDKAKYGHGPGLNPWHFVLIEIVNSKGEKILTRK